MKIGDNVSLTDNALKMFPSTGNHPPRINGIILRITKDDCALVKFEGYKSPVSFSQSYLRVIGGEKIESDKINIQELVNFRLCK